MLSPVLLFKSLTTLGTRTERDTERRGARGEMEKEDGGGDELSVGGRQSGLKSTEKKEVIRKEAKREREKERGPQRSRRLGQPPGQAARAGSAFAAQKSLWLRLKLRFLLLLPVVITEVTSPLLLFIWAVSRNLSERGFKRDFLVNICLPVAF